MSRYIDADAVIARIAGQMSYEIEVETGNETDCVDLAEELLNDIPSIDIPQWIPCSERLPSENELVLVSGEYIEYPCVISKGEDVHYWYSNGIVCIAWMPLPKPYGERKESE